MGSDPQYAKWPLLPLSQHVFTLTNAYASKSAQEAAVKALQDAIAEDKMAPFYRYLAHPIDGILNAVGEGGALGPGKPLSRKSSLVGMVATKASTTSVNLPWDEALYSKLKEDNDKELAEFQKEEDEAVEQAGETEVMAAKGKRADFWARVGDKDKAIAAFEDVFEKTGILGTKIDLVLAIIRMGLFYGDKALVQKHIERAKTLVESGGDWDRRNRLKAYEGLHLLTVRSYNLAAPLLLDSLSTFTSYELCTYSNLVVYSVLAGSVSLKRVDFNLYNGNYKTFFQSLASVEEQFLNQDRYLHEHKSWFIREMRLRAYQQLLQSYRVVGLESMANDFGVTVDFLDRDLARFIAAGRIPCTIDRVTGKGVIETNRPDDKNKQYQDVVRQGDQLITKLQKYGQAVRLRGSERA
ncbi:putative 26S proteasome regulatory subunit rpn7 [Metarhizium anisopliae]